MNSYRFIGIIILTLYFFDAKAQLKDTLSIFGCWRESMVVLNDNLIYNEDDITATKFIYNETENRRRLNRKKYFSDSTRHSKYSAEQFIQANKNSFLCFGVNNTIEWSLPIYENEKFNKVQLGFSYLPNKKILLLFNNNSMNTDTINVSLTDTTLALSKKDSFFYFRRK